MIKVYCNSCMVELVEPGALVFSPPIDNIVNKYHICSYCWKELFENLL